MERASRSQVKRGKYAAEFSTRRKSYGGLVGMRVTVLFALIITFGTIVGNGQEFTFTTTAKNIISSRATIDYPGLAGNPNAIIVATPTGNTASQNPHPIGAWYYNDKWNIFNTDHAVMPPGMTFSVRVFLSPDSDRFLHTVTKDNTIEGGSFIDHPTLNSNPAAHFVIFQNHAPDSRSYNLNPNQATAIYSASAGKWVIRNINGKALNPNTAYNVVISSRGTAADSASIVRSVTSTPTLAQPVNPTTTSTAKASVPQVFSKEGVDRSAASLARSINGAEEKAMPPLLTALQRAGFYILDNKGAVKYYPESGKGQGLGFFEFEADGSLKLDNRGVRISLVKMAASIVKNTPQITPEALAGAVLSDLQTQSQNATNADLRFWARLIIELGKGSSPALDLMTSQPKDVTLSVLQATLLTRRLQGDLYTLKSRIGRIDSNPYRVGPQSIFVNAAWIQSSFDLAPARPQTSPCNLTGEQALILDAAAVGLTTGQGALMELINRTLPAAGTVASAVGVANIALAWGKLVASVTALKGELTVEQPVPLKRTKNSVPGEKRLLTARVWSEVGDWELLNCVRPALNIATGLDFNLPTDGPLGDVLVEWEFDGENATNKASKKFVYFEPLPGASSRPNNQVTNDQGISKINLVGSPKVPGYAYFKNPMTVRKSAGVLVAVRLKSSKDFVQNWIDIGGAVIGVVTGGPLGLVGAAAEIGFRAPITVAHKTVPVTDHEECDDRWFTLEYTATVKGNGVRPAGVDGSPEITWSFDRLYEGNIGLYNRRVNLTPAEMMNLEAVREAEKAERKFVYYYAKGVVHAVIDDRIESITKEVCSDKTNQESSDLQTWKANGDFPIFGIESLFTDRMLHTYNVSIPVGSQDDKALKYFRIKRVGRSGGVRSTIPAEEPVTRLMGLLPLPAVLGIIRDGVVAHDPEKDIPESFPREWEFDSGMLMPDTTLIKDIPETRTDVKVRIFYRFVFGCR